MKEKIKLSLVLKLAIPLVILVVLLILKLTVSTENKFSLARYAVVGLEGFNNRATATVVIDELGLYKALAGEDSTSSEQLKYKEFVETVTCSINRNDKLSNGDELIVSVDYNKDIAEQLGIKVDVTERKYIVQSKRSGNCV